MQDHPATRFLAAERPVRACLVGAGKFGSMFLSQVPKVPSIIVTDIVDLSPDRAREACRRVGWDEKRIAEVRFSDDAAATIHSTEAEVLVEATGHPGAGIFHAEAAFAAGRHVVMVNVEADVLAGPLLARHAAEAGVIYGLAYGDQPALICELVEWARTCGFDVVGAGKGTRYLPSFHASTPATVWKNRGVNPADAEKGGMNPQMFNSFLDGTKSAIEMAAVANATGLLPAENGLTFPPASIEQLPQILKPASAGGTLERAGQVEVVSSANRDGSNVPNNIRWGVFVTFTSDNEYTRRCFREYGLALDDSADAFRADVVATAKRDLRKGEVLDGEGGYMAWGKLMPAAKSLALGGLPIGLAHGIALVRDVLEGACLTWDDVRVDPTNATYRFRREMEQTFRGT